MNPANGRMCLTGNLTTAVTAKYACNDNFYVVGSDTLICGDNGQWNENPPLCKRKQYIPHCKIVQCNIRIA